MISWIKALRSETVLSIWWVFSTVSTLSTFFVVNWEGKPRIVFALFSIVGFGWANFKVFQKQEAKISALALERDAITTALAHRQETRDKRSSELILTPAGNSQYVLASVPNIGNLAFNGGFLEFECRIENRGNRNSTVDNYQIEILEFGRTLRNLVPEEGRRYIQGRRCNYALNPARFLTTTRLIRIDAESVTNQGILLFSIPDLTLENFAAAGMKVGAGQRFGPLNCLLTITDTMGASASALFELHESQ
jgi:hypothetical protein